MARLPDLSRAEYDILNVLWKTGRQSVREVHDAIVSTTNWAYSTTKTVMDRMIKKKLLKRESFHGVYLYTPLISRPAGLAKMVHYFADRVLETDYASVVALFGKSQALPPEEIDELARLLDDMQKGERHD